MRFRTKQRPRGLLHPSHQKRLALMIGGFGLVLLAFTIVKRPAFWSRLFPDPAAPVVVPSEPQSDPSRQPPLQHDEFLVPSTASDDRTLAQAGSEPDSASDVVTHITNRVPLPEATATTKSAGLPRVPADLLRNVKDDVIGVHSTESDAYFASMKMASKMVDQNSARAPKGAYALFMDAPEDSRGVAWHIAGQLRRLSEVRGRTNAFGVGALYDAWITTRDSGDQLVHVVAMKASPMIAQHINTKNGERSVDFMGPNAPLVEFTGYFFKREAYASRKDSGISLAPLFVAGTLHDIPPVVASTTRSAQLTPYLGWLALFVALGVLFMIWSFTMNDVAHAQTRTHQLTKLPAHMTFEDITAVTVGETLRDLERSSS
ncbi:MAG: hypothetical protein R3C59_26030 [Planctomycetaceae bacterium]